VNDYRIEESALDQTEEHGANHESGEEQDADG
jgi:hypothetical protein